MHEDIQIAIQYWQSGNPSDIHTDRGCDRSLSATPDHTEDFHLTSEADPVDLPSSNYGKPALVRLADCP
jgi:hypothetical protein